MIEEKDRLLLTHFETYLLTEKRSSVHTFAAYKNDVEQLLEFLFKRSVTSHTCTEADLAAYMGFLKKEGLTPRSVARKISSIKLFFEYAHKRFEVSNTAQHLIFPKIDKTFPTYLTDVEVEQLLEATRSDTSKRGMRNSVMIYLLYASGMRVSELVNISTHTIFFDTGFIQCRGKGDKERSIPMPALIMQLLRHYLETIYPTFIPQGVSINQGYLFASYFGGKEKALSRQSIWLILKRLIARAGIKKNISPHSLRHSLATHLLKNGVDLRSLQLLLGHENLRTVEIYTHLDTSQLRKIYDKAHPRA